MDPRATRLFFRISGTKAWVAFAVIIALALFGYYLAQGVRYCQAASQLSETSQEVRSLERKISSLPKDGEFNPATSSNLEQQLSKLEDLQSLFKYSGTDDLLAIVSDAAASAELELLSMRADVPIEETLVTGSPEVNQDGDSAETASASTDSNQEEPPTDLAYHVQPVTISLEGPAANLSQFLTSLQKRVPVVSAPSIRIAGLDIVPTSQIQLLFYLSPHEVPEDGTGDAGSAGEGSGNKGSG